MTRLQAAKKSFTLFIILILISCNENSLSMHKAKEEQAENLNVVTQDTTHRLFSENTHSTKTTENKKSIYQINNLKIYSDENFKESVSFIFVNTSDEIMSNIMFEESYFADKYKKGRLINKKINLNPKDSIKFVFNRDYDDLTISKIRFTNGLFVNLGNFLSDNVDTKLGEWKN